MKRKFSYHKIEHEYVMLNPLGILLSDLLKIKGYNKG